MKYLLVLLCCSSFISAAVAKCSSSGIYIKNNTIELNKEGLVVLEFYANSQSLIPHLNTKYPVYLKSSESKLTLVVKQIHKGYHLTQVVLIAETSLNELLTYGFHMDKLPRGERKPMMRTGGKLYGKEIVFTVSKSSKQTMPSFAGEPAEQKKTFDVFGCGPAKWVYFKIGLSDTTVKLVKALVRSKIKGTTTGYILPVENGVVAIGHGMCSGPFDFEESDYEIAFALLDSAGNEREKTKPLAFEAPVLKAS